MWTCELLTVSTVELTVRNHCSVLITWYVHVLLYNKLTYETVTT